MSPLALILAFTADAATKVLTAALGIVGAAAGAYATRQSILSQRRKDAAEHAANLLRERTVDREDFESVVEGLRGVLAERTAQYNDLLGTHRDTVAACRAERDEHVALIRQLEADVRSLRRRSPP